MPMQQMSSKAPNKGIRVNIMSSRSQQQESNARSSARPRPVPGSLGLAIRSRRLGAIACLVALCGVVFGVGGALAHPDGARPARAAHVAHVRAHATHRAARPHRLRMGVRAARAHRAHHRHHRAHRRLRPMVARAHHGRRAHARRHARHAAHAAAWHRAAKRHRRHKKGKKTHRLTMRSFVARLSPATATIGGQSLPGSLIAIARPGSGALAPSAAPAQATSAAAAGSPQLNVLANRVRAVATGAATTSAGIPARASGTTATATATGTATQTRTQSAAKHAPVHKASKPGAPDTTFLLPLGVPAPIEHLVNRVPEALWIALASALALAGVGGAAAVRSTRRARRQAGEYAAVAAVALTDPLTGVLNRRGFGDVADRELARARRYRTPFVLAYVDVRGLKAVNDSEGHLAGDAVIRQVAQLLSDSVRTEDAVGRLGGDELALLLTGQSATGADAVLERIEARVPACRAELGLDTAWDITIGTASFPADGATFEELVATADRRLYEQRGIQLR